jgi:hypothetical protein
MTLQTVEVDIKPQDALRIFEGLEQRVNEEGWQLVQQESHPASVQFVVWVDGCDTATTVTLSINGTWSMRTHVSLGEEL